MSARSEGQAEAATKARQLAQCASIGGSRSTRRLQGRVEDGPLGIDDEHVRSEHTRGDLDRSATGVRPARQRFEWAQVTTASALVRSGCSRGRRGTTTTVDLGLQRRPARKAMLASHCELGD